MLLKCFLMRLYLRICGKADFMNEMLDLLANRRSAYAPEMGEPGPSPMELEQILQIGLRVPDHGKLEPWRLLVFQGEGRVRFGKVLVDAMQRNRPNTSEEDLALEKVRFLRAPVVVAVISSPLESQKIPEWEQILSAGALCENLLIAAEAMGYSGQWITEWYAYDSRVVKALGLTARERIAGFIYLGTPTKPNPERRRPKMDKKVREWMYPAGF